jgi:hypothetical protein
MEHTVSNLVPSKVYQIVPKDLPGRTFLGVFVEKLTKKKAKMTKVFVKGWVASKDKEVAKFKHVFDATYETPVYTLVLGSPYVFHPATPEDQRRYARMVRRQRQTRRR